MFGKSQICKADERVEIDIKVVIAQINGHSSHNLSHPMIVNNVKKNHLAFAQVVIAAAIFICNILVIGHATRDPYNVRKVKSSPHRIMPWSITIAVVKNMK